MVVEVTYSQVLNVTMTWDKLKQTPNYEEVAGELIFLKLFELEPKTKSVFKIDPDEYVRANPKFYTHARIMVDMIDCAVGFLGPDLEPLEEEMIEMGRRHVQYGVSPSQLPYMVQALLFALQTILTKNKFDGEDEKSWRAVFGFLTSRMLIGMKEKQQQQKRKQSQQTDA